MYDFKNSIFPNLLLINRAKYIFSRDMFCLFHFRAKMHGVVRALPTVYFIDTAAEKHMLIETDANFPQNEFYF